MTKGVKIPTFRTGHEGSVVPMIQFKDEFYDDRVMRHCRRSVWSFLDLSNAPKLKATETRCV